MSVSGANFKTVMEAKAHHDATCRYGGKAIEVHMNPADIERCGWEDGDEIGGMTLVSSPRRRVGYLRVYCDAELNEGKGVETTVAVGKEIIETVAA